MKHLGQLKSFPGHDVYWDGKSSVFVPPITREIWAAAVARKVGR